MFHIYREKTQINHSLLILN